METTAIKQRLLSLDVLRGADMFLLTVIGPVVMKFSNWSQEGIFKQFYHVEWEGFVLQDLIMPLFMFMSGITIPFSMAKYRRGEAPKSKALLRVLRRVIILWIFGMIAQGNLLKFNWEILRFYSNTLQTIAVGYAACALIYLYCPKIKWQIGIGAFLLLAYWAAMMFIRCGEYGGGDFTQTHNLCEYIDIQVLGTHRDCYPSPNYHYTWILSSLTFIVTVLLGLLSGEFIKGGEALGCNTTADAASDSAAKSGCRAADDTDSIPATKSGCRAANLTGSQKALILLVSGIVLAAAGWLWGLQMPVIKHIWTSSMTLVAGGYSIILLAGFYYLLDVLGKGHKALGWLRIYGMNALLCYMLFEVSGLYHVGFWPQLIGVFVVLLICYRFKIFLRA